MSIYAAIVLGVFFLAGIILHNWLQIGKTLNLKQVLSRGPLLPKRGLNIVFYISGLAYITFTGLLLDSNGRDQKVGMLFLLNATVLVIGIMLVFFKDQHIIRGCIIAAIVQVLIFIIMLGQDMGNIEIVFAINIGVVIWFVLLGWLNFSSFGRRG